MKTKITSLLALLLLGGCLPGIAQKSVFAPIGAKWHYGIRYSNASPEEYYRSIEAIKDTLIKDKTCSVLQQTEHLSPNSSGYKSGFYYLYSENQKVYAWNKSNEKFELLYDFVAEAGDAWQVPCKGCNGNNGQDFVTIKITKTDWVEISGKKLKRLFYNTDGGFSFGINDKHIIEYIGGKGYLFLFGYAYDDMYIPHLRCYSDDLIQFQVSGSKACDYITSTNDTEADKALSFELKDRRIYFTNAELSGIKASIYNISGLCITNTCVSMDNNIDITNVAPGIYFLKLLYADQSKTFKFVIP